MSSAKHTSEGSFVEKNCAWCGKIFVAKKADVKRGWARCCSKSCAASLREKKLDRFGFRSGGDFSDAHLFSNEDGCNRDF